MAKSLAEQLLDIANKPVNQDLDIENEDTTLFEHKRHNRDDSDSDGSSSEDENNNASEHYVKVAKSKLRQSGPALLNDAKYTGAKGSRAELFNDNDSIISESHEQSEEELESDAAVHDEDSEAMSVSEDELISESEEEDEEEEEAPEDEQLKRERLAKLVQQETKQAINKLSQSTQRDAAKGLSILEQSKVFDSTLDVRIKLQKALTAANCLPLSKVGWKKYTKVEKDSKELLQKTSELLNKVFGQITDLRAEFQNNDHINQIESKGQFKTSSKRSFDDICKESKSLDKNLKEYRVAVLNKWSTKVASASGNSALSFTKFKAINQPADVQVENQLADLSRLIKRTCLNRRSIVPLNFNEDMKAGRLSHLKNSSSEKTVNGEENENDELNLDIPKNYDPRRKDNNSIDTSENPYIFDDEDFYRVLLNDLVDKKISTAQNNQGNGATIAITSRSNNKLKKNIDTKASKGRKLNYSVQEEIAHYEAPFNTGYKWSDEQIDEFFAGLLGQKVNFREDEDEALSEDNEEGNAHDLEAIKNDDIQIFG